jgi:hypothetical protein
MSERSSRLVRIQSMARHHNGQLGGPPRFLEMRMGHWVEKVPIQAKNQESNLLSPEFWVGG